MAIDYSQTVNRFTQLDAYPLPRIDDMVQKIAQYSICSTLDLKSAYHQVPEDILHLSQVEDCISLPGCLWCYQWCSWISTYSG